ncbi:PAAR domain-containing protein, partial [Ralstonia solanacearum]
CSCPREGHHDCVIIEGDEHFKVDGVPVAFEGHKTSCGATLIATVTSFGTT